MLNIPQCARSIHGIQFDAIADPAAGDELWYPPVGGMRITITALSFDLTTAAAGVPRLVRILCYHPTADHSCASAKFLQPANTTFHYDFSLGISAPDFTVQAPVIFSRLPKDMHSDVWHSFFTETANINAADQFANGVIGFNSYAELNM